MFTKYEQSGAFELTTNAEVARGLSPGEKVARIRNQHRYSQKEFARLTNMSYGNLVKAERGEIEFTKTQLSRIKNLNNLKGLPLLDEERVAYVSRLYLWLEYIRIGRMDEARTMREELMDVVRLEVCDYDLSLLFKMLEIRLMFANGDYDIADMALDFSNHHVENLNNENLHHYYFNRGIEHYFKGDYEESVKFFLKALDIYESNEDVFPNADPYLYYNIANCYTYLDLPNEAVFFLLKAKAAYDEGRVSHLRTAMDSDLASNYIVLNQLRDVEKLLANCLINAKSMKEDALISNVLFVFGRYYKKTGDYAEAIDYFDKALEYCTESSALYFPILYYKTYALIAGEMFTKATLVLRMVKKVCKDELWVIYFTALTCYLSISRFIAGTRHKAAQYIENIAIPRFREAHDYLGALDYYQLLENHYTATGNTAKTAEMTKEMLAITLRCYTNNHKRSN